MSNYGHRTSRDYAENLPCCCPQCIADQPWRARLRKSRVKAAVNALTGQDAADRARKSREAKAAL